MPPSVGIASFSPSSAVSSSKLLVSAVIAPAWKATMDDAYSTTMPSSSTRATASTSGPGVDESMSSAVAVAEMTATTS